MSATEVETIWTADDVARFMDSPLVQWIKTFKKSKEDVDFEELNDSVFLLDVLQAIDGVSDGGLDLMASVNRSASLDRNAKLRNWMLLILTLHRCYFNDLQQLIVLTWPDVFVLAAEADRGGCLMELQKFLILILGYAVQCDRKEDHIETIKNLKVEIQQALIGHIRQVTETSANVVPIGEENRRDPVILSQIVQELCLERLKNVEKLVTLSSEGKLDFTGSEPDKNRMRLPLRSLSLNPQLHDGNEATRNKIRSLKEELEEKTKLLMETREQLCAVGNEFSKTKSENAILAAEVRAAKIYKDEHDAAKEAVYRVEKYRKDIDKYKNIIADIDFYKTRLEELRKDNDLLIESKATTELQLTSSNKRIEKVMDELVLSQIQLENIITEKSELKKKLVEVVEEKAKLDYENSQLKSGLLTSTMSRYMSITSIDCLPMIDTGLMQTHGKNSISDEVNETLMMHLTRVQIENEELKMKMNEANEKYQDLEQNLEQLRRENEKEFEKRLEELQQHSSQQHVRNSKEMSKEFEQKVLEIEQRSKMLRQKVSKEFQQKFDDMEQQNRSLQRHIEELQKQICFIEENWKRDRDTCAKLHGTNEDLLSEKRHVRREVSIIRDNCRDKIGSLEKKAETIEKDTASLQKQNKKIRDLCDDSSLGTMSDISRYKTSSNLNDNDSLAYSQSSACDMDASYMSSFSSKASTGPRCLPEEGKNRTPICGVVAPVVRSTEQKHESGDFSLKRSGHTSMPKPPPPDLIRDRLGGTFSRNDKFRHSMPARTLSNSQHRHAKGSPSKYWAIGGQKIIPPDISYSYNSRPRDANSSHERRSSREYDAGHHARLNSSTVSEATGLSQGRLTSHQDVRMNHEDRQHQWQVSYMEKSLTQETTESILGDDNSHCRVLVDQLMRLQMHSKQLVANNATLRQQLQTERAMGDKLNSLEDRNLQLEVENKRLMKIIESLRGTVPQSLYDKRTYQFNTSV